MAGHVYVDEISYEFNTTGFYNILFHQLRGNESILDEIHKNARSRLQAKRTEYTQLSPTKTSNAKQSINPNYLQLVKVTKTDYNASDDDDDDKESSTTRTCVIDDDAKPIEFEDTDDDLTDSLQTTACQSSGQISSNEKDAKTKQDLQANITTSQMPPLTSSQCQFARQITGDDVVDSLLMKLSAHMTI